MTETSKKTPAVRSQVAGGAIAAAALVGAFGAGAVLAPRAVDARPIQVEPPRAGASLPSFADLGERVSPAVVSITVVTEQRANTRNLQIPGFPDLEELPPELRRRFEESQRNQRPRQGRGLGSGFFISEQGHIVTNNHVVEDAKEITVTMSDGRELKATLVGSDERSDIAVLKVDGGRYPYVQFAPNARVRVGDWVVAIGNPFGFSGTATAGIVSADGRDLGGGTYANFIQIDAPINRGNSGGPAFDLAGNVIGVNTAIFSGTGGNVGIGFAIPARLAQDVTQQIIRDGKVTYGWLGVTIQDVTREIADSMGLKDRKGAIVSSTTPGAPAATAGLRSGDVVVRFDGQPVEDASDLTRKVGSTPVGRTIRLEVARAGGAIRTVNVTVAARPSERQLAESGSGPVPERETPGATAPAALGLTVSPPTADERTRLRVTEADGGVIVRDVADDSPAVERGVQSGLMILEANGQPIRSAADLKAAVEAAEKAGRASILLLVQQPGGRAFVPVPLKK